MRECCFLQERGGAGEGGRVVRLTLCSVLFPVYDLLLLVMVMVMTIYEDGGGNAVVPICLCSVVVVQGAA